jgi:hypothetical protein
MDLINGLELRDKLTTERQTTQIHHFLGVAVG